VIAGVGGCSPRSARPVIAGVGGRGVVERSVEASLRTEVLVQIEEVYTKPGSRPGTFITSVQPPPSLVMSQ
jgi:hypothetical protein